VGDSSPSLANLSSPTRRQCPRLGLRAVAVALVVLTGLLSGRSPLPTRLATADRVFLDTLERRALRFFVEHSDPVTGLTQDRAPTDGSPGEAPASIAASGFALTAWCIGAHRGWLGRDEALDCALRVLRFVDEHVAHEHGWIYHFVDVHSGARFWNCEASTIDTALFLQGAVLAREYLQDAEVTALVNRLYARVDWNWARNGGSTLTHGWTPEKGFLRSRWDSFSELPGLYLLGLGASANALPAGSWDAWRRGPVVAYGGRTFINCPPLFTHQFPHAWFDLRGQHDGYADYWQNSVDATLAQREWCSDLSAAFPKWSRDLWGVTSSDSAHGYVAWGGPHAGTKRLDGTVVPCAPGGSLPFAPAECLSALRAMKEAGGARVWGRYGFADAFNPHNDWVSPDVVAIDLGITLAMAENLRSGFCWSVFMQAPEAQRGLQLAGFKRNTPGRSFESPVLLAAARSGELQRLAGVAVRVSADCRWQATLGGEFPLPLPANADPSVGVIRVALPHNRRSVPHAFSARGKKSG